MPRRYYPKSHIIEGLFTKGKEWMKEDGTEYIGPYHKYIDKLVMTGGHYNEKTSVKLIAYVKGFKEKESTIYDSLIKETPKKVKAPRGYLPKPTPEDYKKGFMTRYFVKKRNEISEGQITEIDIEQYKKIGETSGIDITLYFGIVLQWKISGPINDVIGKDGKVSISGIKDTNLRSLSIKERMMPGITQFLGDLLEFSIHSKLTMKFDKEKV